MADWTKDLARAFDFRSPERVARFVLAAGLKPQEMELILAFDDPRYNIPLPIDGRYGVRGLSDPRLPIPAAFSSQPESDRYCASLEQQ